MITESLINDSCVQEFFWYTIVSRHVISSWLLTNCAVTSNICFNVRLSWFFTTFCMVEEFFPRNVAAFNVVSHEQSPSYWMFGTILFNVWHSFLSNSHLVPDFIDKFCYLISHDEFSKWAFLWRFSETGCPILSWNSLFDLCRTRSLAEKIFFTMRVNFPQWIPRIFIRLPWSIVLSISTFPQLRRPGKTIILCIVWSWRFNGFHRSIVKNSFVRILMFIQGLPCVWWGWRRHERRRSCGQIHHRRDLAVTRPSPESCWARFAIAAMQEVELKWLILFKVNKWFHTSHVWNSLLVKMSASWFLVSIYLILNLGN